MLNTCMTFCGTAAGSNFTLGRQIWVFDDCSSGIFQHFVLSVAIRGLRAPLGADVFVRSHLQGIVDCHRFLLSSILAVLRFVSCKLFLSCVPP